MFAVERAQHAPLVELLSTSFVDALATTPLDADAEHGLIDRQVIDRHGAGEQEQTVLGGDGGVCWSSPSWLGDDDDRECSPAALSSAGSSTRSSLESLATDDDGDVDGDVVDDTDDADDASSMAIPLDDDAADCFLLATTTTTSSTLSSLSLSLSSSASRKRARDGDNDAGDDDDDDGDDDDTADAVSAVTTVAQRRRRRRMSPSTTAGLRGSAPSGAHVLPHSGVDAVRQHHAKAPAGLRSVGVVAMALDGAADDEPLAVARAVHHLCVWAKPVLGDDGRALPRSRHSLAFVRDVGTAAIARRLALLQAQRTRRVGQLLAVAEPVFQPLEPRDRSSPLRVVGVAAYYYARTRPATTAVASSLSSSSSSSSLSSPRRVLRTGGSPHLVVVPLPRDAQRVVSVADALSLPVCGAEASGDVDDVLRRIAQWSAAV